MSYPTKIACAHHLLSYSSRTAIWALPTLGLNGPLSEERTHAVRKFSMVPWWFPRMIACLILQSSQNFSFRSDHWPLSACSQNECRAPSMHTAQKQSGASSKGGLLADIVGGDLQTGCKP